MSKCPMIPSHELTPLRVLDFTHHLNVSSCKVTDDGVRTLLSVNIFNNGTELHREGNFRPLMSIFLGSFIEGSEVLFSFTHRKFVC